MDGAAKSSPVVLAQDVEEVQARARIFEISEEQGIQLWTRPREGQALVHVHHSIAHAVQQLLVGSFERGSTYFFLS